MSQNNTAQPIALAPPRLVRTGHTEDSISVIVSDDHLEPFRPPFGPNGSAFTIFDIRQQVPVNNSDHIPSFANMLPRNPPEGAIFCITDIPPGGRSPMHRTVSLDYCIVLHGEIVLILDGGEEKIIKAGEFMVQQGANHQWFNNSDQTCRMACVMLGADKLVSRNGEALEATVFKKTG